MTTRIMYRRRWGGGIAALVIGLAAVLVLVPGAEAKTGPATSFAPQTGGAYDYGVVADGSHKDQTFTLTNSGGTATAALKLSLTGSSAFSRTTDTCSAISLGPAKKCTVTVRYAPTGQSTDTATLTAVSTKPAATATITLNGTAGYVDVEISPSSHDYGSSSGNQTFTATNNGTLATGSYTFSGPTDEHFGLGSTNTCDGNALAPGASCSFTITFTAPAQCAGEPALYLDTASLGSYASVTFQGEQPTCEPDLIVDPAVTLTGGHNLFAFLFNCFSGVIQCATIDELQSFTLTNDGTAAATGLQMTDDFAIIDDGYTLEPPIVPGDCQNVSTLAVNGSCTFSVRYTQPAGCDALTAYDGGVLFRDDANSAPDYALSLTFVGLCQT